MMKWMAAAMLFLTCFSLTEEKTLAQAQTESTDTKSVLVYPSIAVPVNKSVIIQLPKRATRVVVTQPRIAEGVLVAPDRLLINGKAVGATSLVIWTEEPSARKQ